MRAWIRKSMQYNDLRPKTHEGCQNYDARLTQPVVVGDTLFS